MTGALKIVKLDFLTVKSQASLYLSLVAIILLFGFMRSSVIVLCITGAWYTALMVSNIFIIQEKNHLDRLYGSVAIRLKDIIFGRYVFVLLNYVMSFAIIIAIYAIISSFQHKTLELSDMILGLSLSLLAFSLIVGIQMPLFFKMGYTKAKVWSLVPFIAVMALVLIPSFVSALSDAIHSILSNRSILIAGCILASVIVQFLSYRTSVSAYRKRK